jgi:hypothetical protein
MRFAVCTTACFHWLPVSPSTKPVMSAATKTPVPAAESQLIVNLAGSGFAFAGATGAVRCTWLCSAGMSHAGSESVPVKGEPSSVVFTGTFENALFRTFLSSGVPHSAQHAMRMTQGIQARTVCFTV